MATIREWLDRENFDWEKGVIVYQEVKSDDGDCLTPPGWACDDDVKASVRIDNSDPILDKPFDTQYGSPQCPRFIAFDENCVYFPAKYDGATWIERVFKSPWWYIGSSRETPYPGGG